MVGAGLLTSGFGQLGQPRQRPAENPRNLHLRNADLSRNLRLGHVTDEAKPQDLALPGRELARRDCHGHPIIGQAQLVILGAEGIDHRSALALAVIVGGIQRGGVMSPRGLERVKHVLDAELEIQSQLLHRRGPAGLGAQLLLGVLDLDRPLLSSPGHVHRPAQIPEISLELAKDRRHGERGERRPTAGVESVHRLDEAETGDLEQIIEGLASTVVASGQLARQRQEAPNQLVSGPAVLALMPAGEEYLVADARGAVGFRPGCCGGGSCHHRWLTPFSTLESDRGRRHAVEGELHMAYGSCDDAGAG